MVAREDRYNALVVDPEVEERMRLKQAAVSVYHFNDVYLLPDLRSALERLQSQARYDVVFVSQNFSEVEITDFIKRGKLAAGGNDAAYVLLLHAAEDESAKVAAGVMLGADGVLMEPYSVDSLVEITQLAARVKRENTLARERAAITFLVKDIIKQIDRLAAIRACNFDVGRVLKQLREMCSVFRNFDEDSEKVYFEIMIDLFENCPVPPPSPFIRYKGASQRVKKMMEKKLLESIGAADPEEK